MKVFVHTLYVFPLFQRTRKLLKQIVENNKTLEENKKLYTYKNFLETMRKYLGKIFKQFPKPLLLEVSGKPFAVTVTFVYCWLTFCLGCYFEFDMAICKSGFLVLVRQGFIAL